MNPLELLAEGFIRVRYAETLGSQKTEKYADQINSMLTSYQKWNTKYHLNSTSYIHIFIFLGGSERGTCLAYERIYLREKEELVRDKYNESMLLIPTTGVIRAAEQTNAREKVVNNSKSIGNKVSIYYIISF